MATEEAEGGADGREDRQLAHEQSSHSSSNMAMEWVGMWQGVSKDAWAVTGRVESMCWCESELCDVCVAVHR